MKPGSTAPEVVAAVARHMNEDHAADSLLIVARARAAARRRGGRDDRHERGRASASRPAARREWWSVDVPWSAPITTRAEVRTEVVRMYEHACAALGVDARGPSDEPSHA